MSALRIRGDGQERTESKREPAIQVQRVQAEAGEHAPAEAEWVWDETRTTALRMTMEGNSFASAGRVLEVNPQTIANWVKAHVDNLPERPAKPEGAPEQVEIDELFTFLGSKKQGVSHHGGRASNPLFHELGRSNGSHQRVDPSGD